MRAASRWICNDTVQAIDTRRCYPLSASTGDFRRLGSGGRNSQQRRPLGPNEWARVSHWVRVRCRFLFSSSFVLNTSLRSPPWRGAGVGWRWICNDTVQAIDTRRCYPLFLGERARVRASFPSPISLLRVHWVVRVRCPLVFIRGSSFLSVPLSRFKVRCSTVQGSVPLSTINPPCPPCAPLCRPGAPTGRFHFPVPPTRNLASGPSLLHDSNTPSLRPFVRPRWLTAHNSLNSLSIL